MPNINVNQFGQQTVRGQVDMNISQGATIIQGVVSASQATALQAGDTVKLDTTSGVVPSFVAAGTSDVAIGMVVFDAKKSSPVAGDVIQVALLSGTAIMWLVAAGTIAVGVSLEDTGSRTLQLLSAGKMRGVALDPGTANALFRVILRNSLQS